MVMEQKLDENGHADYPHTYGTLPDCPKCDLMEAHETWKEIKRGKRCPADILHSSGLSKDQRRLVETAMRAEEESESEAIPVIDVLHRMDQTTRVKAQVAEWLDPDLAHEFQGTRDERREFARAADKRAYDRRDDALLAQAAELDPENHGWSARIVRENAARIRDHRENHHRQESYRKVDAEQAFLAQAREVYEQRDAIRALGLQEQAEAETARAAGDHEKANEHWHQASLYALQVKPLDDEGSALVAESIEAKRQARWHEEQADAYAAVNRAYERSETYRLDRAAEREGE